MGVRYSGVTSCPSCGASAPAGAAWCGQCYQRLSAAPASGGEVTTDFGGVDRFGIVHGPAAAAPAPIAPPPTSTPDRFGIVHEQHPVAAPMSYDAPTAVATLPPPPAYAPAPTWAPPPPIHEHRTGSLGWQSIGLTVIGAILLGGIVQLIFWKLAHHDQGNVEKYVRTAIPILVFFYAIVAAVVIQRVTAGKVRLFWSNGNPAQGIMLGAAVGLTLGLTGLAVNSAIAGHLATDPGVALMASEGDIAHILATILLTMIAAPLVEETLFRGLFAESLRVKNTQTAIWVSALAFALWHWRLGSLRYYALMGALFAALYVKRGLVCSIAAHACFNGVLTIAAIYIAISPGHTFNVDGVRLTAPTGWHAASADEGVPSGMLGLEGPSGASVGVFAQSMPTNLSLDDPAVVERIRGTLQSMPTVGGLALTGGNVQRIDLPAGPAIEYSLTVGNISGEEVVIAPPGKVVVLFFTSAGSSKANADFQNMLSSVQVS